ncbi:MAG: hypothetical protein V9G98_16870 [Candidatus Competibacter sp.]
MPAIGLAACGKENKAQCALLGGFVGALLGTAAGIFVDTKQSDYASTEDYYDQQIKEATKLNQELAQYNRSLRNSIQADQRQTDRFDCSIPIRQGEQEPIGSAAKRYRKEAPIKQQQLEKILDKELEKQKNLLAKMQQEKNRKADLLRKQIKKTQDETTALRKSVDDMGNLSAKVGGYL